MKSSTWMLLLCMFVFQVQASEGRTINLSGRLCNEHMDATAARAIHEVPNAVAGAGSPGVVALEGLETPMESQAGSDTPESIVVTASSGMVVVSYDLDGSRQAVNSRIMFSSPGKGV